MRAFLVSLKLGWRWMDGGLYFTESWRLEDESLPGEPKTRMEVDGWRTLLHSVMETGG